MHILVFLCLVLYAIGTAALLQLAYDYHTIYHGLHPALALIAFATLTYIVIVIFKILSPRKPR